MPAPDLLDVKVLAQRNGFTCGPTSLAAVCHYHGEPIDPRELERLCRTTSMGTDHANLVRGALFIGARVFEKAEGTLAELDWFVGQGLPVIVGWWSRDPGQKHFNPTWDLKARQDNDCGHFSVFLGSRGDRVWLMDPQERPDRRGPVGRRSMKQSRFLEVWYDTDTDDYRPVARWYAVVHFTERGFSSKVRGGGDHR